MKIWKEIADVGGLELASFKFPNKMKEDEAEKKMKSAAWHYNVDKQMDLIMGMWISLTVAKWMRWSHMRSLLMQHNGWYVIRNKHLFHDESPATWWEKRMFSLIFMFSFWIYMIHEKDLSDVDHVLLLRRSHCGCQTGDFRLYRFGKWHLGYSAIIWTQFSLILIFEGHSLDVFHLQHVITS